LRSERERVLHDWLARHAMLHPAGFGVLDAGALGISDPDLAERALAHIAGCVGAASYQPRRERVARLRLELSAAPERARTLGGCRFMPWRGRILVLRELAAAEPPLRLEPGESQRWDHRFRACVPANADRVFTLDYLGRATAALPRHVAAVASDFPRLAFSALPAFYDQGRVAVLPALGYRQAAEMVLPQLIFCPANPLTNAGFTVV
jgi:tRNA(Ile)-lysidine synthase